MEKLSKEEIETVIRSQEDEKNKIFDTHLIKNPDGSQMCDARNILLEYMKAYTSAIFELNRESFIKQAYWNDNIVNFKYDLLIKNPEDDSDDETQTP